MISRDIERSVLEAFITHPVVAILGAKQTGKTTFVKKISANMANVIYLDFKIWGDLEKLYRPQDVFQTDEKCVICLDNIQLAPELLPVIDACIAEERTAAKFILTGTMSVESFNNCFPKSKDKLHVVSLPPLTLKELYHPMDFSINRHWLRGGFPESYFSTSDSNSVAWRNHYLESFIENDCPKMGIQLSGMQTYRLLNLFAMHQDGFLNASKMAGVLNVTHPTIRRYVEILEQAYMMRTLLPFPYKTKKRLVKAPKIYFRDSGLYHQLLSISDIHELRSHSMEKASWKGYVVENILSALPEWEYYFYEAASGYRLDLVLQKGERRVAVKIYLSPQEINDNFWHAIRDIRPDFTFIIVASTSVQEVVGHIVLCELPHFLDFMWREIDLLPPPKRRR